MQSKIHNLIKANTSSIAIVFFLLATPIILPAQEITRLDDLWPVKSTRFFQGFDKVNEGSELDFFPFLDLGYVVLYVGENEKYGPFEFETERIPDDYDEEYTTFIWHAGYARSLPDQESSAFKVFINNNEFLTVSSYKDGGLKNWQFTSEDGTHLAFVHTHSDKAHGDVFGYMILNVPVGNLEDGVMVIRFEEVRSNPRDYLMAIQNPVQESVEMLAEPAILKTEDGPKQSIKIDLTYLGKPTKGSFLLGTEMITESEIVPGPNEIHLLFDPVEEMITKNVVINLQGKNNVTQEVTLKKVRPFEVYYLPHSHVDIGFTHKQSEVAELQWRNLDLAIDLAEKTRDYPEGSRYKWNAEISWVLDGYLKQTSEERKDKFIKAVENGSIGIDALYGSVLTGLQREEELFKNTLHAQQLRDTYGFDIQSAMITDVPGYTWGIVPALAQTGIRYFSVGPNHMPQLAHGGYQVGKTFEAWGDIPMYWVSPSGKEKILFWMSSHGYSWFHSWLMGNISHAGGGPILNFLDELEQQKYPYDIVQLRYNIGNDNGPPDPDMPDFFKAWNEKYEWPKFKIATTLEMMTEFTNRYEDIIPEATGDFTPYWEDGASSSAEETSINRLTADRLVQAETLWALFDKENYPEETFNEAWKNVVLFSEHTWGANISKSDPDAEFTRSLWEVKQGFALDAQRTAERMVDEAVAPIRNSGGSVTRIQVINTLSWSRTDLVRVPTSWDIAGDRVLDDNNKPVPSQRLSTGELAFLATDIPPLGSKSFTFRKGKVRLNGNAGITNNKIENELISVEIDPGTGGFRSVLSKATGVNFIDSEDSLGFNRYWYSGKIKEDLSQNHSAELTIKENGPLVASLLIESSGEGARKIRQEIEIISGLSQINITNIVDKHRVVEDENVRFTFPFDVPDGEVRIDIPWTVLEPGKNQLRGANNNFYSVQRFLDISNQEYGITLTTEDAPIWEIGDFYGQHWMTDMKSRPWLKDYVPSQRLIAWVMNNLWFVNYKAYQEGEIRFRHTLKPHEAFNPAEAKKLGMERSMPLIVVPSTKGPLKSAMTIKGSEDVLVTSYKPGKDASYSMVRLFNSSKSVQTVSLSFDSGSSNKFFLSSPLEEKGGAMGDSITLTPWQILTIRVE